MVQKHRRATLAGPYIKINKKYNPQDPQHRQNKSRA